ncbi:hypothetical protein N9B82_01765 [Saprospiraceae bacterium]|nr:hypothetical protein [Saprospiraceae bacterium]
MGFSGSYIAGHSGTQLKTRDAFSKAKEHLDLNTRITSIGSYSTEFDPKPTHPYFKKAIGFLSLILLITAAYITTDTIYSKISYNQMLENGTLLEKDQLHYNAYINTLSSAEDYLSRHDIARARIGFEKAMTMCPHEIEPVVGMYIALHYRCYYRDLFCTEKDDYLKYLQQSKQVTPELKSKIKLHVKPWQ